MGTHRVKRESPVPPESDRVEQVIAAAIRALPFGEEVFGELPSWRRSNCGYCIANFEVVAEGTQLRRPRILITFSRSGANERWKLFDIEVSGFRGLCEFSPSQLPQSAQMVGANTIYLFESSLAEAQDVRLTRADEMAASAA